MGKLLAWKVVWTTTVGFLRSRSPVRTSISYTSFRNQTAQIEGILARITVWGAYLATFRCCNPRVAGYLMR